MEDESDEYFNYAEDELSKKLNGMNIYKEFYKNKEK